MWLTDNDRLKSVPNTGPIWIKSVVSTASCTRLRNSHGHEWLLQALHDIATRNADTCAILYRSVLWKSFFGFVSWCRCVFDCLWPFRAGVWLYLFIVKLGEKATKCGCVQHEKANECGTDGNDFIWCIASNYGLWSVGKVYSVESSAHKMPQFHNGYRQKNANQLMIIASFFLLLLCVSGRSTCFVWSHFIYVCMYSRLFNWHAFIEAFIASLSILFSVSLMSSVFMTIIIDFVFRLFDIEHTHNMVFLSGSMPNRTRALQWMIDFPNDIPYLLWLKNKMRCTQLMAFIPKISFWFCHRHKTIADHLKNVKYFFQMNEFAFDF